MNHQQEGESREAQLEVAVNAQNAHHPYKPSQRKEEVKEKKIPHGAGHLLMCSVPDPVPFRAPDRDRGKTCPLNAQP